MVSRQAYTCSGRISANLTSPSTAVAFPSSHRSFAIVTGSAWVHLQVLLNEFAERHRRAAPGRTQPLDHLLKRLFCLSASRDTHPPAASPSRDPRADTGTPKGLRRSRPSPSA